jgi:hypothetical protein
MGIDQFVAVCAKASTEVDISPLGVADETS